MPNHSSNKHPWFLDSMKSNDSMYSDFYVWADGTGAAGDQPPNDIVSNNNGSSLEADGGKGCTHRLVYCLALDRWLLPSYCVFIVFWKSQEFL